MNNYVKKRRPYSHEDSPPTEPVLHDTFSTSSGFDSALGSHSWSPSEQYILQHAASTPVNIAVPLYRLLDLERPDNQKYILEQVSLALNEPISHLLYIKHRYNGTHNKRRRLDHDASMPSLHTTVNTAGHDDGEKSPSSGHPSHDGSSENRKSSSAYSPVDAPAGWTRARLTECFASFSMCPPCSTYDTPSGYQPLPTTTAAYSYDATPSLVGTSAASVHPHPHPPHPHPHPHPHAVPQPPPPPQPHHDHFSHPPPFMMEQRNIYPRDDFYACDAPFLSQWYPPLQPSEVTETQPTTSGEGMYYPANAGNADNHHNAWNPPYNRSPDEEYEDCDGPDGYDDHDSRDVSHNVPHDIPHDGHEGHDDGFGKEVNAQPMNPTGGPNMAPQFVNNDAESLSFHRPAPDSVVEPYHHHPPAPPPPLPPRLPMASTTSAVSAASIAATTAAISLYDVPSDPEMRKDSQDSGYGTSNMPSSSQQRPLPSRRGPFKNHEQRQMTARTRKIGSCVRCRMQRVRCVIDPADEHGPCLTCKKGADNKIWRAGCLRWKITNVRLYKPGQVKGLEWTKRWRDCVVDDISTWSSSEMVYINVTEGYSGLSVKLRVRRFEPQDGDKLDRSWISNGVKKSVTIPPFAIVDMEAARTSFDHYIKQAVIPCCKNLLGPEDGLLSRTYNLAIQLMTRVTTPLVERRLIKSTLELWMSVRLTTKSFEIVGEETLGMPRNLIRDQTNSLCGKIPLPPVMGAQLDSVLIHQLQPQLRRKTLDELQKMVLENKINTWLTLYLVIFILLHNTALITRHDAEYAKKHGLKRRFARQEMVKEYNTGANVLLAYWHYCNKGTYPFSKECKESELASLASLDEDEKQFVRFTREYASENKSQWQKLWNDKDYEEEYFYVSQLYEQEWLPRLMD